MLVEPNQVLILAHLDLELCEHPIIGRRWDLQKGRHDCVCSVYCLSLCRYKRRWLWVGRKNDWFGSGEMIDVIVVTVGEIPG